MKSAGKRNFDKIKHYSIVKWQKAKIKNPFSCKFFQCQKQSGGNVIKIRVKSNIEEVEQPSDIDLFITFFACVENDYSTFHIQYEYMFYTSKSNICITGIHVYN